MSGGVEWQYMVAEAVHLGCLLRVQPTTSPRRYRWYVTDHARVLKPAFKNTQANAEATGFSATFEDAQRDAVAMAEALHKSRPR